MTNLQILDCTLRDGGYCNQWIFKNGDDRKILHNLQVAGVDIIECGYLKESENFDFEGSTCFKNPERLQVMLADIQTPCVAMVNFGEVSLEEVLLCKNILSGIRVAFHKNDWKDAMKYCEALQKNGMQVYVQPMVTMSYNIQEFRELLEEANRMKPEAFYIVDSFGAMQVKDITEYAANVMEILTADVAIGFHGHNNMQMVLANAIKFLELCAERKCIIDTCVMGMGRGAGNLNTEMFIEYCNKTLNTKYSILPLMKLIDEIISRYYEKSSWGYSWTYYVSAIRGCHPNYAKFLDEKKTLTYLELYNVMMLIDDEHKSKYNEEYVEGIYRDYLSRNAGDIVNENDWKKVVQGKKVLLLAPGMSIIKQKECIEQYIIEESPIVISINVDYAEFPVNYVFVSNLRRFRDWKGCEYDKKRLIVTSNIPAKKYFLKITYENLLSKQEIIADNAGIMALNFLKKYEITEIVLAGFDGYVHGNELNYAKEDMRMNMSNRMIDELNIHMGKEIRNIAKSIPINFLTHSRYEDFTEKI